jgi:charged multivesicular body protein 2A
MAKKGQTKAVGVVAKDLNRTRTGIRKFHEMECQLQSLKMTLQLTKTTATMHETLRGITTVLKSMNKATGAGQMQAIMREFEKQLGITELAQEMMNEAIDETMDDADADGDESDIVNQILDELGVKIEVPSQIPVHTSTPHTTDATAAADDDLDARFEKLRSG